MNSYGSFNLEVKVPEGEDAQQRANEIMLLMRDEIQDPADFLEGLESICRKCSDFLECELEMEDKDGTLLARFIFI